MSTATPKDRGVHRSPDRLSGPFSPAMVAEILEGILN